MRKLISLGRHFVAIAMVAFGVLHFAMSGTAILAAASASTEKTRRVEPE